LAEWDVNHNGENVNHPDVSTQGGCRTLQQENQAYMETITTMRMWAVTKVSRLKAVLS
jgi:hypothetical protein